MLSVAAVQARVISVLLAAVATSPVGTLGGVVSGGGGVLAARNVATAAPHPSLAASVAVAAMEPAAVCSRSSTTSFVLGAAGNCSWITKPFPVVTVAPFAGDTMPITKSPFAVVVVVPLLGDVPVPSAAAVPSSEFAVATPAYSRIANRSVPPVSVSDTVTVFGPPVMFSA